MSVSAKAVYVWKSSGSSKTTKKNGGVQAGKWSATTAFQSTENITITSVKLVQTDSIQLRNSNNVYLDFANILRTQDLQASDYATYTAHSGLSVGMYCVKTLAGDQAALVGKSSNLTVHTVNESATNDAFTFATGCKFTFEIEYIYSYTAPTCSIGSVVVGKTNTAYINQRDSESREHLRYVCRLNLWRNNLQIASTESITVSPSASATVAQTFQIPAAWADYFKSEKDIDGYRNFVFNIEAYDDRTVFDGETVDDHGFGFQNLLPDPVTSASATATQATIPYDIVTPTLTVSSHSRITNEEGLQESPFTATYVEQYTGLSIEVSNTVTYTDFVNYNLDVYRATGNYTTEDFLTYMQNRIDYLNYGVYGTRETTGTYERLFVSQFFNSPIVVDPITYSGNLFFCVYVKDGRSYYSAPQCVFKTVYHYDVPVMTFSAYRATLADGEYVASDDGAYIEASIPSSPSYSSLGGNNSPVVRVSWRPSGSTADNVVSSNLLNVPDRTIQFQNTSTTPNSDFSKDTSYDVLFKVSDVISSFVKIIRVSSGNYTLHFSKGGYGIGIGKTASERDENGPRIEINPSWKVCINETPWITYSTSDPPTADTENYVRVAGAIWLTRA